MIDNGNVRVKVHNDIQKIVRQKPTLDDCRQRIEFDEEFWVLLGNNVPSATQHARLEPLDVDLQKINLWLTSEKFVL